MSRSSPENTEAPRVASGRNANGGAITPIVTRLLDAPVGPLVAGVTDEGVCFLEFADRRAFDQQLRELRGRVGPGTPGNHPLLDRLEGQLGEYFRRERTSFDLSLVVPGTPFQERVWAKLLTIPYGERWSYDRLAHEIGHPGAQRAVGRANGDNRVAIVIPCHRVTRSNGDLCGYGGGLWRKKLLLDLEAAAAQLSLGDAHLAARTSP